MTLSELAEAAARATGLPKATCMTLLSQGWTLVSDIGSPTRWESPLTRVLDDLRDDRPAVVA